MDADTPLGLSAHEEEEEQSWDRQEAKDDAAIKAILSQSENQGQLPINLDPDKAIDQTGKADDALDFEDISDDELPEEEEADPDPGASFELPGLTDDGGTSNDTDDLFGEGGPSSPLETFAGEQPPSPAPEVADAEPTQPVDEVEELRRLNFDPEPAFATNQDPSIPAAPENVLEFLRQTWPDFERGVSLDFNEYFKPKKALWLEKKPPRVPKALVPTKLSLDIDADQEKQFRIPGPATLTRQQKIQAAESLGLVSCLEPEPVDEADIDIFVAEHETDLEPVGGFTLHDISTLCEDWDSIIDPPTPPAGEPSPAPAVEDEWSMDMGIVEPAAKRRKVTHERGLPEITRFEAPDFDLFEEATKRSAKRVHLDLNDPYLLVDDAASQRAAKRPKLNHKMKRMADGRMAHDISQRFNFSNDETYEALKENVRDKVRATLGGVQVEHSLPAIKLLWPYYLVKLPDPSPYTYHRPHMQVKRFISQPARFVKPQVHKRKEFKGQKIPDIYRSSKDVSMNDNSTAVLFEYCEEIPTVLSNFGMGNKIINYYRVKDAGEEKPPEKLEVGENKVLLPEDRSPFAIFGTVDPGEIVPTLQNQMYRAPVFKHAQRKTDFVLGRSSTGLAGTAYYLRKMDHLYVVGQTFPSVEVPGPHSRKVTNTSKNRLKMLSYRLITKKGHVNLGDITYHVKDSNDAQNRQKLKEFLHYDKETRSWGLKEGERLMDPDSINTMVHPEDVCLMDAMQVGAYEVEKSGFAINEKELEGDDEQDNAGEENLANQLAPWKTTKAFIDACTGKAMLKLRGDGDPTGRGLGFSFIKTSMKGGFLSVLHEQGAHATSADAMERERKANGGHSYNVKKQEAAYMDVINDIWNKQRETLQDATTYDDADVQPQDDEDDRLYAQAQPSATPRFDEGMSQLSRPSGMSGRAGRKKIRISRRHVDKDGNETWKDEIVEDPGVIAQYIKRRKEQDEAAVDLFSGNVQWTGDAERDRLILEKIERETSRLEKNQERRLQREKQKQLFRGQKNKNKDVDVVNSPEPSVEKPAGTSRRCANCGQVGHIKTNKKMCPMLNGTLAREGGVDNDGIGAFGE